MTTDSDTMAEDVALRLRALAATRWVDRFGAGDGIPGTDGPQPTALEWAAELAAKGPQWTDGDDARRGAA